MSSVRNWAVGSVIAAFILLSPVVAFLMVIVAEMQIDLLTEAGTAADCTLAAGAIGVVLFRRVWSRMEARQSRREQEPDEATIAAPQV